MPELGSARRRRKTAVEHPCLTPRNQIYIHRMDIAFESMFWYLVSIVVAMGETRELLGEQMSPMYASDNYTGSLGQAIFDKVSV